jgi:hypothetical protein
MPDTNVLTPSANTISNATADDVNVSDVAKESKEQVAVDALKNVFNEVMVALKKIGEDVEKINKRVDTLEKSISIKHVDEKISVDGEKKSEKPKVGEYVTDTVEFAKTSANTKIPAPTGGVTANPEVQVIKSILTANKELGASEIYYLVKKNIKLVVI